MQTRLPLGSVASVPDLLRPAFPNLARHDVVQLDCETNGVSWVKGDRSIGWALGVETGDEYYAYGHASGNNCTRDEFVSWARRELRGKRIENHSIKFDIHMARMDGVDLIEQGCTFHDVAHSAALLDDHRKDFGLDAIAQTYLGEGKIDIGPKDDLATLPAGLVGPYACRDTSLVRRLSAALGLRLAAEDLGRVSRLEDDVIPVAVTMEANGIPVDVPTLEQWEAWSKQLLEKLRWELYRQCGFNPNVDSPKDLARLFANCGETPGRTATGAPSFTASVMLDAATRHPSIRTAWQIGKLVDLRNKYIVKYLKDQVGGVLYHNLWQLMTDEGGTVSGRFSCTRPNLQQVMGADKHGRAYGWLREAMLAHMGVDENFLIKKLCRPASGRVWFAADAKQIEYRIFAHFVGGRLAQTYHLPPTTEVIGGKEYFITGPEADYHAIVSKMILPMRPMSTRTEIKVANFLEIFGGGVGALGNNLNMDPVEAAQFKDAYNDAFPEARALRYKATETAERRGYVRTLYGRRGRFPFLALSGGNKRRDRTHKALNAVIQGSAADINKVKLVELFRERKTLELTLRNTVHDEADGDLPSREHAARVVQLLNEQTTAISVPILWDAGVGSSWAEAK